MKFSKMPLAEARAGDDLAVETAIARLREAGVEPRRPINNAYQLKVTPNISYYPTTGKVVVDATPALDIRGVDALIGMLIEQGLIRKCPSLCD